MRNKQTRNWLIVLSLALAVAALIIFPGASDRNYKPGSAWPYVFEVGWYVVLAVVVIAWAVWWNSTPGKKNRP